VRKTPFVAIGGFPEGVAAGEDLYVWIRMALHGAVACDMRYLAVIHQVRDLSRKARKNSIPYPIIFFAENKAIKRSKELERYVFSIFIKHFISSLMSLKF